jgi:hypothetical protein
MDCKTAQLFLEFARPHANELAGEDAHALEDHLAQCPDCGSLARNERRLDDHLGKTMRAVEVPDQLRAHLLNRLDADRNDWYKRWAGHGLRTAVAAAACLLLMVGGIYGWSQYHYWNRPALDSEVVSDWVRERQQSPPDRAAVEKSFKKMGVVLPDFNYNYLKAYSIADFHGASVPQLVFSIDGDDNAHETAIVYVLSEKQFKLDHLTDADDTSYKVAVQHQPGGPFAYVLVYSGKDCKWLNKSP